MGNQMGGGVATGTHSVRRLRRLTLAAVAAIVALSSVGTASAQPRPFGDVRRLAPVPTPPGFPEGIAVLGQRVYVVGPATFGTAGGPPSAVLVTRPPTVACSRPSPPSARTSARSTPTRVWPSTGRAGSTCSTPSSGSTG